MALPHSRPVYYVRLQFNDPKPLTLLLSDRFVSTPVLDCLPLVTSWGSVREKLNQDDGGGSPSTFDFTLANTVPVAGAARFSDLLETAANPTGFVFEFAKCQLYRFEESAGFGSAELLGEFFLEDVTEIDERQLRLRASDLALLLETALPVSVIDLAKFSGAPEDSLGKYIPRPVGTLRDVKATPVLDGAVGSLAEDLDVSETTFTLQDASKFDNSGTGQVDFEHFTWSGKSGNDLTGVSRAANSTTAAVHANGARVMQIRSSYKFIVGEGTAQFPVKSISNVKARGLATRTTVTVNADENYGVEHAAIITFTPASIVNFHQIPIGKTKAIGLSGVSSTGDGATFVESAHRTASLGASGAEYSGRTRRKLTWKVAVNTGVIAVTNAVTVNRLPVGGVGKQIFYQYGNGSQTEFGGSDVMEMGEEDEEIFITAKIGSNVVATLTFLEYEVTYDDAKGSGKSVSEIVIGEVTADLEGAKDDGSITGAANTLLENPADVVKWLLKLYPYNVQTSSFSLARSEFVSLGLKWAFLLGEDKPPRFSELRRLIGDQARARLTVEAGLVALRTIPQVPSPALILDYRTDVWADQPAVVRRPQRSQLTQKLVATIGDGSKLAFGSGAQEGSLSLPWVLDSATANHLGAFWLAWLSRARMAVDLVGWQGLLPLTKCDCISIKQHPAIARHGGAALPFVILEREYRLGDPNPNRIRLVGAEVDLLYTPDAEVLEGIPSDLPSGSWVALHWVEDHWIALAFPE